MVHIAPKDLIDNSKFWLTTHVLDQRDLKSIVEDKEENEKENEKKQKKEKEEKTKEIETETEQDEKNNTTPKEDTTRSEPYDSAIEELRRLPELRTPSGKLECLVHVNRLIVSCIEKHWDRILPPKDLVVYVVSLSLVLSLSGLSLSGLCRNKTHKHKHKHAVQMMSYCRFCPT